MDEPKPAVLVVDDIEANLAPMAALLRELDCEVVRALSGADALARLSEREFAVMLLDVEMPEMDGFEVARRARQEPRTQSLPILFVTGTVETEESVFRGYDSGAVDVLFKPVDAHVLLSKISVYLELHRSRRRLASEVEAHKRTLADLEAFHYSVSHDLRAPLRPLQGFSRILLEEQADKLGDEGCGLLERISSAASRMERILDDLLRLSQIGRSRPAIRALDIGEVARPIVAELRSGTPQRSVEVVIADAMKANGDARLLGLALENLLRNAWQFTSKRSDARIEIGRRSEGRETVYFVADNGVGFDPAHADRIFCAFERLDASDELESTGIGLAIVKRVIELHGGRIWAEGEPGKGARFSFTLE
jgi:signal transduction histidine kinase